MTWLLNEARIKFLRARLTIALLKDQPDTDRVRFLCDLLLDARERRPRWLTDWLERCRLARCRRGA
ncbi:MAG TPA: hypothetical protein VFA75_07120 [Nevskia sp.]|nr:hypothetical protein [Nevskia sp.]